jgi:hypothetical protein
MARRNMGKNEKLTRKEKQELRKDGEKMREQMRSIVLPTIGELLKSWNFLNFKIIIIINLKKFQVSLLD